MVSTPTGPHSSNRPRKFGFNNQSPRRLIRPCRKLLRWCSTLYSTRSPSWHQTVTLPVQCRQTGLNKCTLSNEADSRCLMIQGRGLVHHYLLCCWTCQHLHLPSGCDCLQYYLPVSIWSPIRLHTEADVPLPEPAPSSWCLSRSHCSFASAPPHPNSTRLYGRSRQTTCVQLFML